MQWRVIFFLFLPLRDGRARGAGGALAPPLLRRMTFYFVLVYGTYKSIKKKGEQGNKRILFRLFSQKNKSICQMKLVFKLLLLD